MAFAGSGARHSWLTRARDGAVDNRRAADASNARISSFLTIDRDQWRRHPQSRSAPPGLRRPCIAAAQAAVFTSLDWLRFVSRLAGAIASTGINEFQRPAVPWVTPPGW